MQYQLTAELVLLLLRLCELLLQTRALGLHKQVRGHLLLVARLQLRRLDALREAERGEGKERRKLDVSY